MSQSLPRTRGDRPLHRSRFFVGDASPPHTRGSALAVVRLGGPESVSPAHAGIGPGLASSTSVQNCLPRTRGDRPFLHRIEFSHPWSPPHTRGSAPDGRVGLGSRRVSPAHAGIGLYVPARLQFMYRLPRTRGDRPFFVLAFRAENRSPPHTRGSAARGDGRAEAASVSPAHAGIGLRHGYGRLGGFRLPRTRGDRPFSNSA